MKVKVTKKQMKENYKNIIKIGYCEGQYMLRCADPVYYSAGVYGWSCDYYVINKNTIISTGYNPIGNIDNKEIIDKYEKKAEKINRSDFDNYGSYCNTITKILSEFISEILKSEVRK